MTAFAEQVATIIRQRIGTMQPKLVLALGSGQAHLARQITDPVVISYQELPDFPICSVAGHPGRLIIGELAGVQIACLQGRAHFYEGMSTSSVKTMVYSLKLLGCDIWLGANASGSLRKDIAPGELVMLTDHINFQGRNPLVGVNDNNFGPRFFSMDNAYDKVLQQNLLTAAQHADLTLHQGVYIGVLGPNFETPAEIQAFKAWGADLVGMSTVPEVIVANHCGMRVGVIATITNYAAGLSQQPITHEVTLKYSQQALAKLTPLIIEAIKQLCLSLQ